MVKKGRGRPAGEPTTVIAVPTDKIETVEKLLNREIGTGQTPTIKVRVPVAMIEQIKTACESVTNNVRT